MNNPEAEGTEHVVVHLCGKQNCHANSMDFVKGSQVSQKFLQLINKEEERQKVSMRHTTNL